MHNKRLTLLSLATIFFLLLIATVSPSMAETTTVANVSTLNILNNHQCLECHDGKKSIEVADISAYADEGDIRTMVSIPPDRYAGGVHSRMSCIDCHTQIINLQPPHQIDTLKKIECITCHARLATSHNQTETIPHTPSIKSVLNNIDNYRRSYHSRTNKDNPDFVNATCHECHDSHFFNIPMDKNSPAYAKWRLTIPKLCGTCHEDEIGDYETSVHGVELLKKKNIKSAVCSDCHATHEIVGAHWGVFKVLSSDRCGKCHPKDLLTYRKTYHGQVTKLGYTHTAKCFDCHESHKTLPIKNLKSTVHPDNRLKTCQKCHDGKHRPKATQGFVSFSPHVHTMDYDRYPQVWIASRFMKVLMGMVFAFFWLHSSLWYYRGWRERKNSRPRVNLSSLGMDQTRYFLRFPLLWRVAHLLFALSVMTLSLTGMTVLNAHTAWAPIVAHILGGAENMALIHRVAALVLVSIFLAHLGHVLQHLLRNQNFDWFGPDSLIPNKKDFYDCRDMFKWFFNQGPKPKFDRWTYYEKFDYWAVFWGIAVIGISGLLLAFPHSVGQYLEGWVFNVAILIHGEEAFLAIVFLFTVHFFNNHFRSDRLSAPDIVMFTGTQSLEKFQRNHPSQYERLLANGELEKHLVNAPSTAMTLGSKFLGLLLIAIGLILLFLVINGYLGAP